VEELAVEEPELAVEEFDCAVEDPHAPSKQAIARTARRTATEREHTGTGQARKVRRA
jgi:hypothetical protein